VDFGPRIADFIINGVRSGYGFRTWVTIEVHDIGNGLLEDSAPRKEEPRDAVEGEGCPEPAD
jgi:hypothetical protein